MMVKKATKENTLREHVFSHFLEVYMIKSRVLKEVSAKTSKENRKQVRTWTTCIYVFFKELLPIIFFSF